MTLEQRSGADTVADASLRAENLSVRFNDRLVLDGIDLQLTPRGMTVVIGPSGSGKTTLLRAINRLNECFPGCRTSGTVHLRLDGGWVDTYGGNHPLPDLRRRAAMVFQSPNVLPVSIQKNLLIPLRAVLGRSPGETRDRLDWALAEVGLIDEVRHRLGENALTLSGGQQQRLCLARALALEPTFLLLDEPTANLDYRAARGIEELMSRLQERYTLLAVSHGLGQARRLARRVVVLREGRVVRTLEARELADAELFRNLVEEVF
jgi:phosphate transport system ATP-binding protein